MRNRHFMVALGVACLLAAASGAQAPGGAADRSADSPTIVLDTMGMWRIHETLAPPVVDAAGAVRPLLSGVAWADEETASPDEAWTNPDFDDRNWLRGTARLVGATGYLARLCLRGKFNVTDPGAVKDLKLSISYQGGVIVYLNGKQLTRGNIAPGAKVAESYPADIFLDKGGELLGFEGAHRELRGDDPRLAAIRRSLADIVIPARMLRKGTNVVAVDVVRAPYPKVVDEKRPDKQNFWLLPLPTCRLNTVQLTASAADGLVPNAVRPAGFQVWNTNLLQSDYDADFGDPNEQPGAIRIAAARNGSFSGKVAVGSDRPIGGLEASVEELKGPAGAIAASQITVRFAAPWGSEQISPTYSPYPYPVSAALLGRLLDRAPDEIAVSADRRPNSRGPTPWPQPVPGAVTAVWLTVDVPADARAGVYTGALTIRAKGEQPVRVPVELSVADWSLPNPDDYRTLIEIIQSPDTLAEQYSVPLWSDKHWELIARSFRLMSDSGSRFVYVPLIAETNFGHGETMIRWVKRADGKYDYDFSILDRYLDAAEKNLGKPQFVVCLAWDAYMLSEGGGEQAGSKSEQETLIKARERAGVPVRKRGPVVTALDRASGKASSIDLPRYEEPTSADLWKPLYDQLVQHLAKRGLADAMVLGMLTDAWPTKAEVDFLARMAPGVNWISHAHFSPRNNIYTSARLGYRTGVWSLSDPGATSLMGWNSKGLLNRYYRQGDFDSYPPSMWRNMVEYAISGNQRGIGRLGGEFWPVLKNRRGEAVNRIYSRYPESNWRNLDIYTSLLAPGDDGAVPTAHYMYLLEGIQECQARIFIEAALIDPARKARLGDALAARCQSALDAHLRCAQRALCPLINRFDKSNIAIVATGNAPSAANTWYAGSEWRQRAADLYALAGEVARKAPAP